MTRTPEVIGVAGTNASGKNTLGGYLVKNFGYVHVSTGDMVRAEAMKQFGNIERETLQKVAPAYRQAKGAGVFVDLALDGGQRPIVVDGIRALGEARAVKKAGGVIVFVDADPTVRYRRMKGRARDAESQKTFEEFMQLDENERQAGAGEADYNVAAIRDLADIHLDNSGDPEDFYRQIREKLFGAK
ncbi:MAG: AAA family ATPase [Candidatus Nomurabacteria bacterium]|jgi:dephospho-CoA kinase|nr:AAA family ATPase [Candidatus Nomurabacteria bacterium]